MLAVGRALARDVKLLLLDEPYEGLAPVIVQEIERTLRDIKSWYPTIVIEQNAVAALKLADRSVIMDTGSVVFHDGSAEEVLENEQLRHDYLAI